MFPIHMLGLHGIPRRIPGANAESIINRTQQLILTDRQEKWVKKLTLKGHFLRILLFEEGYCKILLMENRISNKVNSLGWGTRTRSDLPYTSYSASLVSGSFRSAVGRITYFYVQKNGHPNRKRIFTFPLPQLGVKKKGLQLWKRDSVRMLAKGLFGRSQFYSMKRFDSYPEELLVNQHGKTWETPMLWRQAVRKFDRRLQIVAPEGKLEKTESLPTFFDNSELKREAAELVRGYFRLVSQEAYQYYQTYKIHFTSSTLPSTLSKLQIFFLESDCLRYYAVRRIRQSSGWLTPGSDGCSFTNAHAFRRRYQKKRLQCTRYGRSEKSNRIKIQLPKKSRLTKKLWIDFKQQRSLHNFQISSKLYRQAKFGQWTSFYFQPFSIKRVWISKSGSLEKRPLDIPTLRDRVLQIMVDFAVHPVVERQADSHSFACRPGRSAVQAVRIRVDKLNQLGRSKRNNWSVPVKVSKEKFDRFKGSRFRQRLRCLTPSWPKRRRRYQWRYWIIEPNVCDSGVEAEKPFRFHSYYRFVNLSVQQYFDQLPHSIVLERYPLNSKYRFMLKAWLRAPIQGYRTLNRDVKSIWRPVCGVLRESILGPVIINTILDGLEECLIKDFSHYCRRTRHEIDLRNSFKKLHSSNRKCKMARITILRFADDILIFGKVSESQFKIIHSRLQSFFFSKKLGVKLVQSSIQTFCPGSYFDYLGFRFHCVNLKSAKMRRGRFTKRFYYDPYRTLRGQVGPARQKGLLLTVHPSLWYRRVQRIRKTLAISQSSASVQSLIRRYNAVLYELVNYFGLTSSLRNQLHRLDYLGYRRFWKLLLRKFGSKPGVRSFVRSSFYDSEYRVVEPKKKERQLKVKDVQLYGHLSLASLRPSQVVLSSNRYCHPEKWAQYERKLKIGANRRKLL